MSQKKVRLQPKLLSGRKAVSLMVAVVIITGLVWWISSSVKKSAAEATGARKTPTTTTAAQPVQPTEKFSLTVGQPTITVSGGPETQLALWSNKPFIARSRQSDGKLTKYRMPSGQSSWTGAAPTGHLVLEGLHDSTVVEIQRIR